MSFNYPERGGEEIKFLTQPILQMTFVRKM
jgi:hypothetical protein